MYTLQQLLDAGLPVKNFSADDPNSIRVEFDRPLSPAELKKFDNIQNGIVAYETKISPSQQIILADGEDVARVRITGEPGAVVEYSVNGQALSLVLDASGIDTIQLDCDTPNTTLLVQAGTARAVIYAVEVPS